MSLPPPLSGEPRARLLQAMGRIESFAERVQKECADQLSCGEGCDDCCRQVLALRGVEAAYLLEGVRALSPDATSLVWGALANQDRNPSCPLLHDGLCLAYDYRPAVCRTHGLPMVRPESSGPLVHCCPKNFRREDLSRLPPSLLLDEERLALLMDTVDALYARETGWDGRRIGIDELLRAGLQN